METKGVRIYQTIMNVGKVCVGVFEGNDDYIEKKVKPIYQNRKVEFITF